MLDPVTLQREYYASTAFQYDKMHVHKNDAHFFALHVLSSIIDFTEAKSVLDVGSGTGRAVEFLSHRHPKVRVVGLEPAPELREIGHSKGLGAHQLVDGDAMSITYEEGDFDITCEFGVLHHIKDNEKAVREMSRVAKLGVFLSDSNNFGQGNNLARFIKQCLHKSGTWPAFNYIRTKGKGYMVSEGDGVFYSYSVFDSVHILRKKFSSIHYMNTRPAEPNLYRTSSQVCIFAHNFELNAS